MGVDLRLRALVASARKRGMWPRSAPPPQLRMVRRFHPGHPVPVVSVRPPYEGVRYAPGDEARWLHLLNAGAEFGTWDNDTLQREILATLLPQGGVFVTQGDELVACAAACDLRQFAPFATLMFVLVHPEHRRKGLGAAVTTGAMAVAERAGYPGILLHTDDHRLPAIHTYFNAGFEPDVTVDRIASQRWGAVLAALRARK